MNGYLRGIVRQRNRSVARPEFGFSIIPCASRRRCLQNGHMTESSCSEAALAFDQCPDAESGLYLSGGRVDAEIRLRNRNSQAGDAPVSETALFEMRDTMRLPVGVNY